MKPVILSCVPSVPDGARNKILLLHLNESYARQSINSVQNLALIKHCCWFDWFTFLMLTDGLWRMVRSKMGNYLHVHGSIWEWLYYTRKLFYLFVCLMWRYNTTSWMKPTVQHSTVLKLIARRLEFAVLLFMQMPLRQFHTELWQDATMITTSLI